ncbi:MFS transporter [Kibdelosporangium philippinense]|uniref:MFS transporter n=1 Tax=Kibdelosporangium philippinense TaxID=211113 RepID=A0ABS8Z5X3_9PSEU|nr:MFS transporter [Kibdelosporangium philippinense]MCE7002170.1 MFS transporter [Kibdelosporangium philippinense]
MYLSTVARRCNRGTVSRCKLRAVGSNVVALGAVSLVTDISAEMVTAILPMYLVLGLHLSPVVYGLVDGLYTGATALLRLIGGYLADRVRKRKTVAGIGYALSAAAKLGMVAAGGSVAAIGAVLTVDRAGKGLRTAPRDALITLSVPESMLGRAFGVHRAMDSAGAFAGPLVALGILAVVGSSVSLDAFNAVFVSSFCVAAIGVLLLVLFVRDDQAARPAVGTVSPRAALSLLRAAGVRRLFIAACVLGMVAIGDGFVYLLLQRKEEIATVWFPLFAVGTNLAYLVLAAPLGALADRFGRLPVVLCGYGALTMVYLLLAGPVSGWPVLVITLGLYGAFYAATDGVLMALAGPVLPEALRATGIALIQTGQAVAYFVSSVLFGLAWQACGTAVAIGAAACAAVFAIVITLVLLVPRRQ